MPQRQGSEMVDGSGVVGGGNLCQHSPLWLFGGPWAWGDLASCSALAWQARSHAWEAGRCHVSAEKSQGMCGLQPKD